MLGLAVAELMRDVRGPGGDAHGEVRQQRGDEIGTRVRGLRDQTEAVGAEARAELQEDERGRGHDRDERGAALRRHGGLGLRDFRGALARARSPRRAP